MTRRRAIVAWAVVAAAVACAAMWWSGQREAPADQTDVFAPPQRPPIDVIQFSFDGQPGENGVPAPWTPTVSRGKLRAKVVHEGGPAVGNAGIPVLWVRSDGASFLLRNQREFNVEKYPVLRWSWKATVLPTKGDVRKNALFFGENRNDQAIQLLVAFEGNKVLSFVWDTTAPEGTEVEEPSPFATVKTRVMDSGPNHLDAWRSHEVDLVKEYRRRFQEPPGKALGIAVQSNANHTDSVGEGLVRQISVASE